MTKNPLSIKCINEIKKAIKQFGVYSYKDKGPTEVMNPSPLVREISALTPEEAKQVLIEIFEYKNGEPFVSHVIDCLASIKNEEYLNILREVDDFDNMIG